jgi:hypothetical protein
LEGSARPIGKIDDPTLMPETAVAASTVETLVTG